MAMVTESSGFGGNFVPVDPAAEGIVHGDAVLEHEGAAGGGGAEAAQGDALAGGVLDARTGAAEELEAGLLAQFVVERDGGIVVQLVGAEGVDGVGGGGQIEGGAGGGDRDLLRDGGGMEDEVDARRRLARRAGGVGFHAGRGGAEGERRLGGG